MEVKDWVLGGGVIVTFLMGIMNLYFNFVKSRKDSYTNIVTAERIKRIGKIRESVSHLLALSYSIDKTRATVREIEEWSVKFEQRRYEAIVQLNVNDEVALVNAIGCFPKATFLLETPEYALDTMRQTVVNATHSVVNLEWQKVKKESIHGDRKTRR